LEVIRVGPLLGEWKAYSIAGERKSLPILGDIITLLAIETHYQYPSNSWHPKTTDQVN